MSDHREALEHIMRICSTSRTYTRRTQQINEVAMHALGMTSCQRKARHIKIMQRVGGQPIVDAYLERIAKRKAQNDAREARKLEADADPHNQQQGE